MILNFIPSAIKQSEAPHDGVCDGLEAGTGGGDVVSLLHPTGQVRLPAQSPGVQCGAGTLDVTHLPCLVVPRLNHRVAALLHRHVVEEADLSSLDSVKTDPVGPVSTIVTSRNLDKAGLYLHSPVHDVLYPEVSPIVFVPTKLFEIVSLFTPVSEAQVALCDVPANISNEM